MTTETSENWILNRKQDARINTIEMKHIRKIADKTKWDRVSNAEIRNSIS